MSDKTNIVSKRFNVMWNSKRTGTLIRIPSEAGVTVGDEFKCRVQTRKGIKQIIYTEIKDDKNG